LARYQAQRVAQALQASNKRIEIEFLWRDSGGDHVQDKALRELGGKGLYVQALEDALLSGEADVAVHSVKDMPAVLPDGFTLAAVSERIDSRDAIIAPSGDTRTIARLQDSAARIGTSSLRRACQLRAQYPGCTFPLVRGNVGTRLEKLDRGEYDALILAVAGLIRLRLSPRISQRLEVSSCIPASGQGAIGVEVCTDKAELLSLLREIEDCDAGACVRAERAICAQMEADCHAAFGVHSDWVRMPGGRRCMRIRAVAANPIGKELLRVEQSADADAIEELVHMVCAELLEGGAKAWLNP
jgi:hydroxymethylbilane synthase